MSPPGRPKGEYRSAQREGDPIRPPGRPKGEYRSAQREGDPIRPPGRPKGEYRSAQREVPTSADFHLRVAAWPDDEPTLRSIRQEVFVVEQHVPEALEWDGIDAACTHVLARDGEGIAIGCGRLLPDGHIGRMAVVATWRGRGVGTAMLERLVALARAAGHARVVLNAQTHAMPFYARCGFAPCGDEYEEAGIPHRAMERRLD